jgi:hypothetical protein
VIAISSTIHVAWLLLFHQLLCAGWVCKTAVVVREVLVDSKLLAKSAA